MKHFLDLEKRLAEAFKTNVTYFEMMRQHNLLTGFEVNIATEFRALIIMNSERRILDAGCGEGSISLWMALAKPNSEVFGVDLSPIGVGMAEELRKQFNIKNAVFVTSNLMALPFQNGQTDTVICMSVLEHIIEVDRVLKEFYRVMREGGKIVIRVANGEPGRRFSIYGWISGRHRERPRMPSLQLRPGNFHNHRENFDACSIPSYVLLNKLRKIGFRVMNFYTTFPSYLWAKQTRRPLKKMKSPLIISWIERWVPRRLLLRLLHIPPLCHMGPTTIVMATK